MSFILVYFVFLALIGPNGNSIFLPSGGFHSEYGGQNKGKSGKYWTSSLYPDWNRGAFIYSWGRNALGTESIGVGSETRYLGLLIRPVRE